MTANIPGLPDWGTVVLHRGRRRTTPAPRTSSSTPTAGRLPAATSGRRPTSARPGQRITDGLPPDVYLPRRPRGPEEEGAALPRHRARRVVLARRRARPGSRCKLNLPTVRGPRPGREGRRPRRRHARPVDLDPRRPDARCGNGAEARRTSRACSRTRPAIAGATTARHYAGDDRIARRRTRPGGGDPLPPRRRSRRRRSRWRSSTPRATSSAS